ncbi:MAG: ATP-grasp domain-containing protein [Methylobacter sp.]
METILIVASSGRMLAQAARNIGLKPLVIDLFADLDMQSYAEDFRLVNSLSEHDLAPVVDYFVERYAVGHVIYGSGFECYPQSLYYLNSRLIMLGNAPDVFARQLDKQAFFLVLDRLSIPHPEVSFNAPDCTYGWLVKSMQGQGGIGIKRYDSDDEVRSAVYWQKFQNGVPHSVLFLADGRQVQSLGFNIQWPVRLSETQEFVFSGVIGNAALPDELKGEITDWLKLIVPVFGLKGLNSLDFIYADEGSYVLEINPRPSASMQLYNPDLLGRHIQLCVGGTLIAQSLESRRLKLPPQSGYQIIYAERDLIIPDQFEWPDWCMDLPKPGDMCRAGQPICSIIAHQNNLQSVAEQLLTKQQLIINKLKGFNRHGIYSQC